MARFDDAGRKYLHKMLDRIMDEVELLEAASHETPNSLPPVDPDAGLLEAATGRWANKLSIPPSRATEVLDRGIKLLAVLCGPSVLSSALDRPSVTGAAQRTQLQHWLRRLHPLLDRSLFYSSGKTLSPLEVIDAISCLDAGETRPIFRAKTGRNRRANRWSLAVRKLTALEWKQRLVALGRHEKQANYAITVAFGEQWDTIRKWRQQCLNIIGAETVDSRLAHAGGPFDPYIHGHTGLFGHRAPKDIEEELRLAGRLYRQELAKAEALAPSNGSATDS